MEPLATSHELPAFGEHVDALDGPAETGGLGALLVVLSPLALAAWYAIGSAVYRALT
jgi:hypothetical protein